MKFGVARQISTFAKEPMNEPLKFASKGGNGISNTNAGCEADSLIKARRSGPLEAADTAERNALAAYHALLSRALS
jgi:hypothetical protein